MLAMKRNVENKYFFNWFNYNQWSDILQLYISYVKLYNIWLLTRLLSRRGLNRSAFSIPPKASAFLQITKSLNTD